MNFDKNTDDFAFSLVSTYLILLFKSTTGSMRLLSYAEQKAIEQRQKQLGLQSLQRDHYRT